MNLLRGWTASCRETAVTTKVICPSIIDIDIVVTIDQLPHILRVLEEKGHVNRGTLGIHDRYAVKLLNSPYRSNTYVILQDSVALRNHLAVREVLRVNDELRQRYAQCKQDLAVKTDSMDEYCEGKSDVLKEILTCHHSLTAEEVQAIYDSNRLS